jgi:hypothetical protein
LAPTYIPIVPVDPSGNHYVYVADGTQGYCLQTTLENPPAPGVVTTKATLPSCEANASDFTDSDSGGAYTVYVSN